MTIVFSGGNSRPSGDHVTVLHETVRPQDAPDEVKLSGRELRLLPDHVCRNSKLKILDVSNNLLGHADLLSQLSGARNLTHLNAAANELKDFPLDANRHPQLEVLCLSGNELESLSEAITGSHNLRRFHCDFNLLQRLPPDWSSLAHLTTLTLSGNRLEEVPATLWTLQRLESLHLQRNGIRDLGPLPEGAASALRELRLARNRLAGTLDLTPLANLATLDASHNDLENLEVSKLEKLETLIVSHNVLRSLTLDGAKLRTLQADANDLEKISCQQSPVHLDLLNISHNNLTSIPDWISEAKSLSTFYADHNQIVAVPKDLFANCHLRCLYLNHNLVSEVPELRAPCHVRTLCLQYNRIEQLPENFFLALPCLESVNLSFNGLRCLPPSYGTNTGLKSVLLSGNRLSDLSDLSNLLSGSRIETLHLAYCGLRQMPEGFFSSLLCLRTLSLSGNGMEVLPGHLAQVRSLRKLYLHSNRIASLPPLTEAAHLQILDLACNNLQHLELASIVPKDLTYLDLSANPQLQIDPTDFQHLCCQRSVAVVDVNCAGRQAPVSEPSVKEGGGGGDSPWLLGFTESQDGNTRLYMEFQKDPAAGRQEALIALVEVEDRSEVSELRGVLPDLLKTEREREDARHHYLRNALLACVRFLRDRKCRAEFGITMCHLSSSSAGHPVALRLGTVGRPSSCILGRAGNVIVLAQRPETAPFRIEDWDAAMQATEVCCHNYLGSSPRSLPPRGTWSSPPDPEVRELVLSPQDQFLVFGDSSLSRTVPADEVWRRVAGAPVAAAKALAEACSALAPDGRRECVAVIGLRSSEAAPPGDEEKYRCWEFMLEENHKLLFTKELETALHRDGDLQKGQSAAEGELQSWYANAFSKYKCPLPSHRGRYYCYGNKAE